MNLLVVEPDKILGETTKKVLENTGFDVSVKRSAQTALDALDEKRPDAIVLEPQLGEHNGIELLYEIASYPEWHDIPIIIYTINERAKDEIFATALAQLKVQTVLYKPETTVAQLAKAVTYLLVTR